MSDGEINGKSRLYHGYISVMVTLLVLMLAVILSIFVWGAMSLRNTSKELSSKYNSLSTQVQDINNSLKGIQQLNTSLNQLNKKL